MDHLFTDDKTLTKEEDHTITSLLRQLNYIVAYAHTDKGVKDKENHYILWMGTISLYTQIIWEMTKSGQDPKKYYDKLYDKPVTWNTCPLSGTTQATPTLENHTSASSTDLVK